MGESSVKVLRKVSRVMSEEYQGVYNAKICGKNLLGKRGQQFKGSDFVSSKIRGWILFYLQ